MQRTCIYTNCVEDYNRHVRGLERRHSAIVVCLGVWVYNNASQ